MQKNQSEKEATRNSALREAIKKPTTEIARLLHTAFPWLTPNEITVLGTLGLFGLVLYTAQLEREGRIDTQTALKLLAAFLALSGTDALDGALARYKKHRGETDHDSSIGQLVDSLSDRVQEALFAFLSIYRAAHQRDKLWMIAAVVSALTNPLSSLVRAYAEKEGIVVPESGNSVFEFFGTRAGRFLAGTGRVLPRKKVAGTSVQAVADLLTAAATTKTTVSRVKAVKTATQDTKILDLETQAEAERRFQLLAGLAVLTTTITGIVAVSQLHKLSKPSE